MLILSKQQIKIFDAHAFDRYVNALTEQLCDQKFSDLLVHYIGEKPPRGKIRDLVLYLINRARSLGFFAENDVTPFAILLLVADRQFRKRSVYNWISAVINATDHKPEERMDAVFALLPDRERRLCFGTQRHKQSRV